MALISQINRFFLHLYENSLRLAYLSKSIMSRDMARMLSEEKVVCSKGIKLRSPPSAKRSS
jgi:hypothetical protein